MERILLFFFQGETEWENYTLSKMVIVVWTGPKSESKSVLSPSRCGRFQYLTSTLNFFFKI